MGTETSGYEDTFDRYGPYPLPLDRSQFQANLDHVGRRLLDSPAVQLRGEDERIRRRWLSEPRDLPGLFRVTPNAVVDIVSGATNPTAATGVLSMHPSGHVRQAAVEVLRDDESANALRFLLVRCGDWVPEVRHAAQDAVERCLDERHAEEMLECLGLLERLSLTSRGSSIAERVLDSVTRFATTEALVQALRYADVPARRVAAQLLVESGHAFDAFEPAMRQADPRTRQIVGEAAITEATGERRDALLRRLLSVSSSGLAELALWTLLNEAPDRDEVAIDALLDRRRRLRTLARSHLEHAGIDAAAFYRNLLERDPVSALRGLGDCGAAADAIGAAGYLGDPDPIVRRAAVDAVARLDGTRYAGRLVDLLADDVVGVAATSARWLSKLGVPAASTDRLWDLMSTDSRAHVVRSSSRAARGLPRWSRLRIALRSAASTGTSLQERGLELADQVLATWNRSFTVPTPEEAKDLAALLVEAHPTLGKQRYESLAFAMSAYGIVSEHPGVAKQEPEPRDSEARRPLGPMQRLQKAVRSLTRRRPGAA